MFGNNNKTWRQRLARLSAAYSYDPDDEYADAHYDAATDAARWATCAVGEVIDLSGNKVPNDYVLKDLGERFALQVKNRKYVDARLTLNDVYARVAHPDCDKRAS